MLIFTVYSINAWKALKSKSKHIGDITLLNLIMLLDKSDMYVFIDAMHFRLKLIKQVNS